MFSVTASQNNAPTSSKYSVDDLVKIYGDEATEFGFDPRTLENLEKLVLMHLARGLAIKRNIQSTQSTAIANNPVSSINTSILATPVLIGALLKSQSPEIGIIMLIDNTILIKKLSINVTNYDPDKDIKVLESIDTFKEAKKSVDTEGYMSFGETALRGATPEERNDVMGFLKETLAYLAKVYKDREKYKVEVGENFNNTFDSTFK